MTDAVGSIDTSNADSGAEAVDTTEAVTATEAQAPAPSQADIAAQAAALAAASAEAALVDAEAVVEEDADTAKKDEKKADKEDKDEDEDTEAEAEEDVAAETRAEVEALVDAAAAATTQDMDDDMDDDGGVSPILAVGLTALVIGGGILILSSSDDDDENPDVSINVPPTAQDLDVTVDEDGTVAGAVTATDPDSTNVTFSLSGDAPEGLTFNSDGTFTFDASGDVYQDLNDGEVLVLDVQFEASDGIAATHGVLTITINGVTDNFAPVAVDDVAVTPEDTDVIIDVLANDTDADAGDVLTITDASSNDGTVTINADGTITFSPDADFNGATTITYTVSDGTDEDTGTVAVTVDPVTDALVAVDDAVIATEDTGVVTGDVTDNDIDVDGGDLVVTPAAGAVLPAGFTINADGTWSFDTNDAAYNSLAAGETLVLSFDYILSDGDGLDSDSDSDTATVTLTVNGANDAPVATNDTADALTAQATVIDVLANDSDDDDSDVLTITSATADSGTVVINDDGTLTFTSDDAFEGDATITYVIDDGNGGTATGTAVVTVTAEPPVISLDVDDDGDPNTLFAIDTDAGTGSFDFEDDLSVANFVSIDGFGDDDTITFIGDASDVSYSSTDLDGDGLADDIQIVANVGGQVTEIQLIDANSGGGIVFNEATAEAAIGGDVFQFEAPADMAIAPILDQTLFIA